MKMKTLNLSKDTFDRDSEFSIDLGKKYPKTAKLYQGYQNDDSIYWALQKSGILKGEYSQAKKAKEVCRRCPHLSECLEWAIPNERFGIWGATNERERGRMRAKLKLREEEVA